MNKIAKHNFGLIILLDSER